MRKHIIAAAVTILGMGGLAAGVAWSTSAAETAQEVVPSERAALVTETFAVEKMTCALCPVTVRTAMERVAGVEAVEVDFDAKTATVTYDPARATAEDVAAASTNAGYPARRVEG